MLVPDIQKILLIDDDEDDCYVFLHALNEIDTSIELHCISDSTQVMQTLAKSKASLIFMDINMPRKNGFECLKEIQDHHQLQKIPIIMYSSSGYSKDVIRAYGLGAVLYLKKPNTFVKLVDDLKAILQLNWVTPEDITNCYFENGTYYPFDAIGL